MKKMLVFVMIVFMSTTLVFSQSWEMVKEGKLGYGPYDGPNASSFVDESTGWLVSDEGRVQKTTNGGMTWTTVREPVVGSEDWKDVGFADANTGYACAGEGFIFKTTDGGDTWTMVGDTANYKADLEGLAVVSADVAYFAGDDSTLLKTTNGGNDFTHSDYGFNGEDLDGGIAFTDADNGVVISDGTGGDTWYTHDGGDTWNYVSVAPNFPPGATSTRIYGVDAGGESTFAITGYNYVTVISHDGGETYSRVGGFEYGFVRNELVDVVTEDIIYVAGDYLAKTTDGGTTFDTLATGSGQSYEVLDILDENTGYVFQNYGQWMKTTDGGSSWSPLLEWPIVSFWGVATPTDEKIVLSAYGGGEISISENGGSSFSYPSNSATHALSHLYECEFINETNGIVAGEDGFIAVTEDGGETFTPVDNPMQEVRFGTYNALKMVSEDVAYAGGDDGLVFRTTDGGYTWESVTNEGEEDILDFWTFDNGDVIIAADDGQVCKMAAGDTSFSILFTRSHEEDIRAVEYHGDVGIYVPADGLVDRIAAGEDSSTTVFEEPDGDDLYDIEFVSDSVVYVVGQDGTILKSEDAGLNWTVEVSPTEETLQKARYRAGRLWAVGQGGIILKLNISTGPELMTIADAKVDADEDGTPDLIDQEVKVKGIVTSPNFGSNTQYYFQDETAALQMYSGDVSVELNIGDEIEVVGTINQYHGLTELDIDEESDVTVLSTDNEVEPTVIKLSELGEEYESMLVTIEAAKIVDMDQWPAEGDNGSVDITNGLDTNYIYIDKESELDGWTPPAEWMRLTAICDQYDNYSLRGTIQEDFQDMSKELPVMEEISDGSFDLEWDFNAWSGGGMLTTADSTGSDWGSHIGVFTDSAYTGLAHVKDLILDDYIVSADIHIIGPADPDAPLYAGIGIRMLHTDFAFYRLVYRNSSSSNNGQIKLQGYDGANWHISAAWDPGTDFTELETGWHNFKVKVEDGKFWVYIDGEELPGCPYEDDSPFLAAGHPGIYKYNTGVGTLMFDNFKVETIDVAVEEDKTVIPEKFSLNQNYPNPFNPTTTISFALPKACDVNLTVYNLVGQQVAELKDGNMNAGIHNFTFEASNLASGIYFYRLKAGNYTELKKMTLLK